MDENRKMGMHHCLFYVLFEMKYKNPSVICVFSKFYQFPRLNIRDIELLS